jgi:high-affinity Fe2+/Pb2+ permease
MGYKVIVVVATIILLFTGLLLGYVLSQLVLNALPLNPVTFLGTLSLIIIFGMLYYLLFRQFRREQTNSWEQEAPAYSEEPIIDSYLQRRLSNLLGGDNNAAERLIEQIRFDNPEMPEPWYWEKAIADLERDRR